MSFEERRDRISHLNMILATVSDDEFDMIEGFLCAVAKDVAYPTHKAMAALQSVGGFCIQTLGSFAVTVTTGMDTQKEATVQKSSTDIPDKIVKMMERIGAGITHLPGVQGVKSPSGWVWIYDGKQSHEYESLEVAIAQFIKYFIKHVQVIPDSEIIQWANDTVAAAGEA